MYRLFLIRIALKAYSLALRERVAAACAQGDRTIGQVAAQFSVSDSFVRKLRRRQRTSGSLAALPHRSGPAASLNAVAQAQLVACLGQQADATKNWFERCGYHVHKPENCSGTDCFGCASQ